MKKALLLIALGLAQNTWAETPVQFIASYSAAAGAGYSTDGARGKAFASRNWGVSDKLSSCTACHTDSPRNPGRHVVTGKNIQPLSPAVNPERFSDPAKVEKWFKRNCKEVVGRACSPAEKADFIQFVVGAR
jgi:hypothetical protein